MYIERVVLNNIKGFAKAELDFTGDGARFPGWAVITGDNGSGKSALLRSIALAILGPEQSRALIPDLSGWASEGAPRGTISVEILPDNEIDRTAKGGRPFTSTFWVEMAFEMNSNVWSTTATDVYRNKKKGATNGPWADTSGWFCVGYGPFRRMYGTSNDAQRLMMGPGRIPRFATLFKEDATLSEGEEWAKRLNYERLEQKPNSELILNGLLKLVEDDFLREGAKIEKITSEGFQLKDGAGLSIALADMSDGYRSALALLVDIYRHMVEVYGARDLIQSNEDGRPYVSAPGVVLIDEIDSHLHPAWQRQIGFWLTKHFPFVQFIVTTHSPIVCQSADYGRIYHLPNPSTGESPFRLSQDDYNKVIAGRPDQILLSPAFEMEHTRSPRAVAALKRRVQLKALRSARGSLSQRENDEFEQLALFASNLEETVNSPDSR